MASSSSEIETTSDDMPRPAPQVRAARVEDVVSALEAGIRDFRAAPLYGLFFGAVYALGGLLTVYMTAALGWTFIAMPMAAGFALIGPFAAVGLYEVSRRRELGEPLSFAAVLTCVFGQGKRELGWMALVSVFAFVVWIYQARMLFAFTFGISAVPGADLWQTLFTTREGLTFLGVGTLWGAVLAVILFSLTVVSFPLLLDQDRDFITAMITSVKAVVASPKVMIGWGLITAAVLFIALLTAFLGLLVVLPVLGHATWHLYRRIVIPT
jgi:uncharacterized membrane protein